MTLSPTKYPNLSIAGYSTKSPKTPAYNCIAWAAGDDSKWWEPFPNQYWPPDIPYEFSVASLTLLFQKMGYEICGSGSFETGYEKVAIFALSGQAKHAARQLPDGTWTSKVGKNIDIEHALEGLEGPFYGQIEVILRREV